MNWVLTGGLGFLSLPIRPALAKLLGQAGRTGQPGLWDWGHPSSARRALLRTPCSKAQGPAGSAQGVWVTQEVEKEMSELVQKQGKPHGSGLSTPCLTTGPFCSTHTLCPTAQRAKENQDLQLPGLQVQSVPQHPPCQEAGEQWHYPLQAGWVVVAAVPAWCPRDRH